MSYKTGARCHAPFPAGIVNDVNYGSSVKALAFLLNNYYNVSIAKTKQCISDITKGVVNISTGMICNLSSEFSTATASERAKIFSLLTHANALYSDATVNNINGKRKNVIKSYYSYGSSHQECLARVLRYLVGATESEPHLKWHKQMHELLQKMIHTIKKNKSGVPKEKLNKRLRDYQDNHLYFLSHPEIDYTNNISERQLRIFKRKQKQAVEAAFVK